MSLMKCDLCLRRRENVYMADDPPGFRVCDICHFFGLVWRCKLCGRLIALRESGETTIGRTAVDFADWCLCCCIKNVSECVRCGNQDLSQNFQALTEDTLCEDCLQWADALDGDCPVTKAAWQDVVLAVVNELPDTLRESVGYRQVSETQLELRIVDGTFQIPNGVPVVGKTVFTWWDSRADQIAVSNRRRPPKKVNRECLEFESLQPMYREPTISIQPQFLGSWLIRLNPGKVSPHGLQAFTQSLLCADLEYCKHIVRTDDEESWGEPKADCDF